MQYSQDSDVRTAAREAIESLPENSTWDDVIYRMYVHQKVDAGLADADVGRVVDTEQLRQRLGLKP